LCKPLEARSIGFLPKKAPAYRRIYPITLVLPHQTHLGAKNALLLLQFLIKNAFLDALRPSGSLHPARAGKIEKRALAPEWSFFTTVSYQKCIFGRFAAFWQPPPRQGGENRKTPPAS
jgi:hypothetical protein